MITYNIIKLFVIPIFILVSITAAIEPISTTPLCFRPERLVVEDTIAYFFREDVEHEIDLAIYDVSDPVYPEFINSFENIAHSYIRGLHPFEAKDSFLFVSDRRGVTIYKVNNFDSLTFVNNIQRVGPSYSGYNLIQIQDTLLFLGEMWGKVGIYNISNIYSPDSITTSDLLLGGIRNFGVCDSFLLLTNGFDLEFLNFQDDTLRDWGQLHCENSWWDSDIKYHNGYVFWGSSCGIFVLEVEDSATFRSYPDPYCGYVSSTAGNIYIYDSVLVTVCEDTPAQLFFCIIQNDTIITFLESIELGHFSSRSDIIVEYNYVYALKEDSLLIFDLGSLSSVDTEEDFSKTDVKLYCQNFTDVKIQFYSSPPFEVEVINLLGKSICKMNSYHQMMELNNSVFPNSGVYFVKINSPQINETIKVLILK